MSTEQENEALRRENAELRREIDAWRREVDERFVRGTERMRTIEVALEKNTELTQEVLDILDACKAGLRALAGLGSVVSWAGRLAAGGLALWGVVYALTHGGRPPGGH